MRHALSISVFLAAATALSGCGQSSAPPEEAVQAIAVSTTQATTETVTEPITGTGTIAAHKTSDLGPSVDGIIEEVMVRVGDRVKAGDPLFRTRDVELKLRMQELDGRVALARAENQNAQANLARVSKLGRAGTASDAKVEDARARADAASAQLQVAEAQLAQAKQQLDDAIVTAPFDGVVTQRNTDEGRFMATRMGGGPGGASGVIQLMKIDIVAAIVQVPEAELARLKLGLPAKVYVAGIDAPFEAKVDVLNDRVEPTTRGVEVRLAIKNPDYAIKPGSFTRAEIYPEGRTVLALERRAVLGPPGARYVYVPENGKAVRRSVTVRELDAARIDVVSGLNPGDAVLSGSALQQLFDGAPITIAEPLPSPATDLSEANP